MRAGIRGILVTFVILSPTLRAQERQPTDTPHAETQPANAAEWFVGLRWLEGERQLFRCAPSGEQRVIAETSGRQPHLRSSLMDAHGALLHVETVGPRADRKVISRSTRAEAPTRMFETVEMRTTGVHMALSPNGRWLVASEIGVPGFIAIGSHTATHIISTTWWVTRSFSWNRDSTQVAFYYALDGGGDDLHANRHGVAVLSISGELQVVLPAEEAVGTRMLFGAKEVPIGWSRCGRYLYYTDGTAGPGDPRLDPPSATFRFDFEGRQITTIAPGMFIDIAPDHEYILCRLPSPKSDPPTMTTAQILLDTGEVRNLPREIAFPRLSCSGQLAVDVVRPLTGTPRAGSIPDLQFYRTSDWQLVGKPVPQAGTWDGEEWLRDFKWITVSSEAGLQP